jgi:hypothetical protein
MKSPTPEKAMTFDGQRSERHYTYEASMKPQNLFQDNTYEERKE